MLPDHPRPRSSTLPPTPPAPSLIQTAACRARPLESLQWCRHHLGSAFTLRALDMPPLVFMCEPDDVRAVVTAPLDVLHPGIGAAVTRPLFGASFMLLEEEQRTRGRETIMPAFHRQLVSAHAASIEQLARTEVASWPLDAPVALHPRLCSLTLTVMLRLVCGPDEAAVADLKDALLSMLSVTTSLVLQAPRLRPLPGWHRTWSRFIANRARVDELVANIITRRRRSGPADGDMLDLLLEAQTVDRTPMTAAELRDNLVAVIIAGYETTAAALAWALQLIAYHPTIQNLLAVEVAAGEREDYLAATVNEVLRHRPVFLFSAPRAVAQPIEIGNWTFTTPTHLLACIYLMHHDPALFPDPQAFRPERFLESRAAARTWLPWGGGRQRCPGRHLALLQLRTVLRTVIAMLKVEPAARRMERAAWRSVIVAPHAGSRVVLRKRQSTVTPSVQHGRTGVFLSSKSSAGNV